jgi:hypothetical protein
MVGAWGFGFTLALGQTSVCQCGSERVVTGGSDYRSVDGISARSHYCDLTGSSVLRRFVCRSARVAALEAGEFDACLLAILVFL